MRRLSLCLLALATISLVFNSCKKDEPETPAPAPAHGNFYAKIANVDWNADFSYATEVNGRLQIVGTTLEGTLLVFDLDDVIAKRHVINDDATSRVSFLDSTEGIPRTFDNMVDGKKYSGFINITKNDPVTKTVSGTFSLVLHNVLDEQLLTVENGVFTVPYLSSLTIDAFHNYDVFFGVYKDAGSEQLGLWYVNPVDGKLVPRNIGTIGAEDVYNNSIYDAKNKNYFAISPQTPEEGLRIHGLNVESGEVVNDKATKIWAPIGIQETYYGVQQPYDTAARQAFVEFSPEGGTSNSVIVDSLFTTVGLNASIGYDGANVYVVPSGDDVNQILRINLITKEQTTINYPYNSSGLEYIGNSTFLTVLDSAVSGSTTVRRYLCEVKLNFGQVELTVKKDLGFSNFADGQMSTTFSKKKSIFYVAYSSAYEMKTEVRAYNTIFGTVASYVIETSVEGIKAKE